MEEILSDLQHLEEADQLCIEAARSLLSNRWLVQQVDDGSFDLENYKLYSKGMGAATLEPQERCRALAAGLQNLSKRSRDMLDDGSTVHEIYMHLQTELYKDVWRYHLCLCEEAKPYFDRLEEKHVLGNKKAAAIPCKERIDFTGCSTKALATDLDAINQLKLFVVSSEGFALHDASKPFTSHPHLMQTVRNVFECFDPHLVSRAFSVPDAVCARFHKNLLEMRRRQHLLLADIMVHLSKEAAGALRVGKSFVEVEDLWCAEVERRNVELGHF